MKKKKLSLGLALIILVCIQCILSVSAENTSSMKINANDFSDSSLRFYNDGSWLYFGNCSSFGSSKYDVDVDIRCWGKEMLFCYPIMSVEISYFEGNDLEHIVARKITIKVANNAYEYQLIEGDPPWNTDLDYRVGATFLFSSDEALIEDLSSAKECTLIAETDINTFTWVIKGKDYEFFLPFIQDMLKYDFLHNVEENETSALQIKHAPARKVYKNVMSELYNFSFGPEHGEDYSFSEDYEAINQAAKSIFYVERYDDKRNYLGSATGFITFEEHLFVTNEHVINGASYLVVWDENDRSYILNQVIAVDKDHDIALLVFSHGENYESLSLETNDNLKRGMPVVAIGSPEGFQGTVSTGIISAFPVLEEFGNAKCIQFSAPTSHGSSGGCLFADDGKVIGITSAIDDDGQNISVAVPIQYLLELYSKWKSNVYDVMDLSGSSNSDTLEGFGKKKEDYTLITGGKINTIVAIPNDFDLSPYILDTMNITVQDFFDEYDEIRMTIVRDAPDITNRTIEKHWEDYYIYPDLDTGIGSIIWCLPLNEADLENYDIPVTCIQIIYKSLKHSTSKKANARACLAVFNSDTHLLDKLLDFYNQNDCENNGQRAGVITSEGYLIVYFKDFLGEYINIYSVFN